MKKIVFILLFCSCKTASNKVKHDFKKITEIDSLVTYMDKNVFKVLDTIKEKGIVEEDYNSYGYFFDKNFPEFGKATVHNHDSIFFVDTSFYYFKGQLIKLIAKKSNQKSLDDSSKFYFENDSLLNAREKADTNFLKSLLTTARNHLTELKKISSKLVL